MKLTYNVYREKKIKLAPKRKLKVNAPQDYAQVVCMSVCRRRLQCVYLLRLMTVMYRSSSSFFLSWLNDRADTTQKQQKKAVPANVASRIAPPSTKPVLLLSYSLSLSRLSLLFSSHSLLFFLALRL